MCGIVWVRQRNGKAALKKIRKVYSAQKHRGSEGFGFIDIHDRNVGKLIRTQYEEEIFKYLSSNRSSEILFHHRYPTSTPNTPNAAHPIPVCNDSLVYDYFVVHNGVIRNAEHLRKKFTEKGFVFTTQVMTGFYAEGMFYPEEGGEKYNDSESLAVELALAIESKAPKLDSTGSIAFIALQVEKETGKARRLYFGRNDSNPLQLDITQTYMKLSSEGAGEAVEPHKLHYLDYATGTITTERDLEVGYNIKKHTVYPKTTTTPATSGASTYFGGGQGSTQKVWDWKNNCYRYDPLDDDDESIAREMGFRVPTIPYNSLPEPRKTVKEILAEKTIETDPIPSQYTLIPSILQGESLDINTWSEGERKFYFVEEIVAAYTEILNDIEYWEQTIECEKDNVGAVSEYQTILSTLKLDEVLFKQELDRINPHESTTKKAA